jgi:hydrogenase/urease accessory protein HupE
MAKSHLHNRGGARLLVPLLLLISTAAFAHDPGLSSVEVRLDGRQLSANAMFTQEDIHRLTEVIHGPAQLDAFLAESLQISIDGTPLPASSVSVKSDGADVTQVRLSYPPVAGQRIKVQSGMLAKLPRGHRQYLSILQDGAKRGEQMLDAEHNSLEVKLTGAPPAPPQFQEFFVLGLEHIYTGYDHLVFLFGLLIVGGSLRSTIKIITSFTVAHSLTLALATLNLVALSGKIVEPLIAASIMYVGIENLFRGDLKRRWVLTFGFGLVHGLGFATALRDLGVGAAGSSVAGPLLDFNLGVELGQLSLAAVALPVIWKLSQRPRFATLYAPACSIAVLLGGGYWFVQRTFLPH